ncbi:MAG: AAA family ATPase [Cyanobacteria bacterium P01_A01_bin.83]
MTQNLETRNLNYLNDSLVTENSEGGVNLDEVKNTLVRKFPLIFGCICILNSLALLKITITPPIYSSGFELLSEPVNIETKVTSEDDSSRETREEITTVELDEVQLKILRSPRLIGRAVESLKDKYPEFTYQQLAQDLTIEIVSNNKQEQDILLVNYQNPNREKVADVVDALMTTYLKYSVEKRQTGVKRGIEFLNRQIPKVSIEVQEIRDQIRSIQKQNSIGVNPPVFLGQIATRLNQLDRDRGQNQEKLRELRVKSERLQKELINQPEKSPIALELATPGYIEILNQLRTLDIEISRKSAIFSDQSEILRALKQERREVHSMLIDAGEDILQKLDNQIAVLENRQQITIKEADNLRIKLEKWSQLSERFGELRQQLSRTHTKLNGFVAQKAALEIDAAQQESPWQVLTPAAEPTTNNVSAMNYLVLSSSFGLLIGSAAAFLLDKYQKIIYTSAKVEEITRLPILTTIPYSSPAEQLSLFDNISFARQERRLSPQRSSSQNESASEIEVLPAKYSNPSIEAFRSFAANLGLLSFNNASAHNLTDNLQSVVITSAIPREGKSTVALNLARASASMGKQVLLVDTDLRNADHLTTDLGFESHLGLKDLLSPNNQYPVFNCIQQLPLEENLFILTSGLEDGVHESAPQDHSRLLASEKMHDLMKELEAQFDLVIYDLCSIIGFADVNLIAAQTDGIVLVTGLGKIQSVALTEALNQLRLCNAPVLGIAVNKVVNKN